MNRHLWRVTHGQYVGSHLVLIETSNLGETVYLRALIFSPLAALGVGERESSCLFVSVSVFVFVTVVVSFCISSWWHWERRSVSRLD